VVCNTSQCDGLSAVKTDYGYRAYDVFRLEDGAWVWCGRRDLLDGHNRFQNSF